MSRQATSEGGRRAETAGYRLVVTVLLLSLVGCSRYQDAGPTAYAYAKSLYAITNRQMVDKLDDVSAQIEAAAEEGELSAREAKWLREIVADAQAGEWKKANRAAREIMEAQIE